MSQQATVPQVSGKPAPPQESQGLHLRDMVEQVEHNFVKGAEDLMNTIKSTINSALHREEHTTSQTTRGDEPSKSIKETPDLNKEALLTPHARPDTVTVDVGKGGTEAQATVVGMQEGAGLEAKGVYAIICVVCICIRVRMRDLYV